MSKVVTIASSAVNAKLYEPTREVKLEVQRILSYRVEGAERTTAFKQGGWDGRSSFFDFKSAVFPAGFVHYVGACLRRAGYTVNLVSKPLPTPLGPENPKVDEFPEDPRYDYQMDVVRRLVKHGQIIAQGATGCHAKGTRVLMADGSLKAVEDVAVGDMLMGPDSTPRNVMKLVRGRDSMYRINPLRYGSPFVVNGEHILSLEQTTLPETRMECMNNGRWVEVTVNDYMQWDKTQKHIHKLHRSRGIDFGNDHLDAELPIDPYLLGLLLGDGCLRGNSPTLTTADSEIEEYIDAWAEKRGCFVTKQVRGTAKQLSIVGYKRGTTSRQVNPVSEAIAKLGLSDLHSGNKFIPQAYKTASRKARLDILAGLIDTDGSNHNNCFDFVSKSTALAADVAFVARSLGFAVSSHAKTISTGRYAGNTYTRLSISGDLEQVPTLLPRKQLDARKQKKDVCLSGFTIEAVGEDDFYGFTVDDDNLYLLEDFTITHNCGKSRIARLAFARINRPTLFLTTRSILMYQMKDVFEKDFGVQCSVLGDGQFGHTDETGQFYIKKMCVGMVQTLVSRLEVGDIVREFEKLYDSAKKKGIHFNKNEAKKIAERRAFEQNRIRAQTISLLSKFEFVILEEAHEASGNGYYEILRHCKNAHYRLALTGTPFMRDDEEANMRLMACSGPVAIKVTEKMLIDRGILAKPYFKFVPLTKKPDKLYSATAWQAAYRLGIVDNAERNQAIVNEIIRASSYGLSSMVLIQHTRHGEMLEKLLKDAGVRVEFIKGENDQAERKSALARLSTGQTDALIGTTILDVGVDVPAVGLVVLAGGGKAEVSLRQRIGRGLRAKKTGPNVALVIDFDDRWNNHTKTHSRQRMDIIKGTEGFCENIVSGDFDMAAMGFSRKKA